MLVLIDVRLDLLENRPEIHRTSDDWKKRKERKDEKVSSLVSFSSERGPFRELPSPSHISRKDEKIRTGMVILNILLRDRLEEPVSFGLEEKEGKVRFGCEGEGERVSSIYTVASLNPKLQII